MGKQCCDKIGYLLFTLDFIRLEVAKITKSWRGANLYTFYLKLTLYLLKNQIRSMQLEAKVDKLSSEKSC